MWYLQASPACKSKSPIHCCNGLAHSISHPLKFNDSVLFHQCWWGHSTHLTLRTSEWIHTYITFLNSSPFPLPGVSFPRLSPSCHTEGHLKMVCLVYNSGRDNSGWEGACDLGSRSFQDPLVYNPLSKGKLSLPFFRWGIGGVHSRGCLHSVLSRIG